jgi:hypothetical protein
VDRGRLDQSKGQARLRGQSGQDLNALNITGLNAVLV